MLGDSEEIFTMGFLELVSKLLSGGWVGSAAMHALTHRACAPGAHTQTGGGRLYIYIDWV